MEMIELNRGSSPVILGFPHTGTHVPDDIRAKLNETGRKLTDTDWHIHELYRGILPEVTTVRATFHRYCLDANRDPSGTSLYPGQNTTGLIPLTDFDNNPLWIEGREPDGAETAARVERFHQPYHTVLRAEIERVKAKHGVAVLYDCHSIRSVCPFLFEGRLPDFNIGTDNGKTCDPLLEQEVSAICAAADGYTCCHQRALPRRLDDQALRPAEGRRARDTDGADAGDSPEERDAALRLRRGESGAASQSAPENPSEN